LPAFPSQIAFLHFASQGALDRAMKAQDVFIAGCAVVTKYARPFESFKPPKELKATSGQERRLPKSLEW